MYALVRSDSSTFASAILAVDATKPQTIEGSWVEGYALGAFGTGITNFRTSVGRHGFRERTGRVRVPKVQVVATYPDVSTAISVLKRINALPAVETYIDVSARAEAAAALADAQEAYRAAHLAREHAKNALSRVEGQATKARYEAAQAIIQASGTVA